MQTSVAPLSHASIDLRAISSKESLYIQRKRLVLIQVCNSRTLGALNISVYSRKRPPIFIISRTRIPVEGNQTVSVE